MATSRRPDQFSDFVRPALLCGHSDFAQRQSPSCAWINASAATAAVSARKMRGPSERRNTLGKRNIACPLGFVEPSLRSDQQGDAARRRPIGERRDRIGLRRFLVAEDQQPLCRPMSERLVERLFRQYFGQPDDAALFGRFLRIGAKPIEIDAARLGAAGHDRPEPPHAHFNRLLRHIVQTRMFERREEIVDIGREFLLRARERQSRARRPCGWRRRR